MDVREVILQAIEKVGGDGLVNTWGECGCEKDDLSPGDCLSMDCEIAKLGPPPEDADPDCDQWFYRIEDEAAKEE